VYVQASRHEGFGLSVAEAMLAGCFPVVSSAGALPEVVGDTGVVLGAAAPAPDVVADAVRRGITVNGDVREHARQRVLERFTLDARGEQLWQVLDEAMGN
jgi:glycosyltransferase involved in cell wall biosynthesis